MSTSTLSKVHVLGVRTVFETHLDKPNHMLFCKLFMFVLDCISFSFNGVIQMSYSSLYLPSG